MAAAAVVLVAAAAAAAVPAAAQEDAGPIGLDGRPQLVLAPDLGAGTVAVVVRTGRPLGRSAGGGLDGRVRVARRTAALQRMRVLHNSPCYAAYLRPRPRLRVGRRYRVVVVVQDVAFRRTVTLRRPPRGERRGAALAC